MLRPLPQIGLNVTVSGYFKRLEAYALSTCSSLIAIVRNGDSRAVQFLHFSVKEYIPSGGLNRNHHHGRFFPQKGNPSTHNEDTPSRIPRGHPPHEYLEGIPLTNT